VLVRPSPPVTPVPPGYGHYCSVVDGAAADPHAAGWAFEFGGVDADPCRDILSRMPHGVVKRAGLWSENGDNNVMVRCGAQGPRPYVVRGRGSAIINQAFHDAGSQRNCVFIVSPTALPIFGHPWKAAAAVPGWADYNVSGPTGFNYDVFGQPWNVAEFGQTPSGLGPAVAVDRHGTEQEHLGSPTECAQHVKPFGCVIGSPNAHTFEPAYDWSMEEGRPLVAVADGIVRGSRNRNVAAFCGSTGEHATQSEIFIETQVGAGVYAERFVAAYHHMEKLTTNRADNVQEGDVVGRGQVIARIGNTGCSGGPHLDFQVLRLTNLTGVHAYDFYALPANPDQPPDPSGIDSKGVNGWQGQIDPFGWAAPRNVDPYAWEYIGWSDPAFPNSQIPGLTEPGAYSIDLWIPGQAPPTY
jgi:murein DD-endopeptidase MepM/ murein hydrolase activator NlpD